MRRRRKYAEKQCDFGENMLMTEKAMPSLAKNAELSTIFWKNLKSPYGMADFKKMKPGLPTFSPSILKKHFQKKGVFLETLFTLSFYQGQYLTIRVFFVVTDSSPVF